MSFPNDGPSNPQKAETRLVTAGRDTKGQRGFVNPTVFHGSTVLYPTADDLHAHSAEFSYGRHGSPTTRVLQDVLMSLEGPQCAGVGLAPSGLAAITTTLLSVLSAGDHVLVTENVYRPSRNFCNGMLARHGVEVCCVEGRRVRLQPTDDQGLPAAAEARGRAAAPHRTLRAFAVARRRHRIFSGAPLTTRSP